MIGSPPTPVNHQEAERATNESEAVGPFTTPASASLQQFGWIVVASRQHGGKRLEVMQHVKQIQHQCFLCFLPPRLVENASVDHKRSIAPLQLDGRGSTPPVAMQSQAQPGAAMLGTDKQKTLKLPKVQNEAAETQKHLGRSKVSSGVGLAPPMILVFVE